MTIAMTLLGGYLGSGKTTRLNELLSAWQGDPIAVVVNDFGAVNVDASLVARGDGDLVELENGCICCSLADGMPTVLRRIAERSPERVLVELSGVALPGPARSWAGYPGFHLAGTVVTVDATTVAARLRDRWVADVVREQVLGADHLLLTGTDLLDSEAVAEVVELMVGPGGVAPGRPLSTRPLADLLDVALTTDGDSTAAPAHHSDRPHRPGHLARTLRIAGPVTAEAVHEWLAQRPESVHRVKGPVLLPSGQHLLQVAGDRVQFVPGAAGEGLVVIARPGADPVALDAWLARAPHGG